MAWRYDWSSAAAHTDEKAQSDLLNLRWWYEQFSARAWRKELGEGSAEKSPGFGCGPRRAGRWAVTDS